MKLVLLSDLHADLWREHAKGNDRLKDCTTVLRDARKLAQKIDAAAIVFGGDLFHRRGVLHTEGYNLVVRELVKIRDAGIPFLGIQGNHDQADKAGRVHALEALENAGLLHSVQEAQGWQRWTVEGGGDEDVEIVGFSYCDDAKLLDQRLGHAAIGGSKRASRILLLHHGFKGARVGTHLEYVVREPIDAGEVLSGYRCDTVFSGHYHAFQEIKGLKGKGFYIGSPLEHSRASKDSRGDKGLLVYDVGKQEIERVPLERPRFVELEQDELKDASRIAAGNFVDVTFQEYPGGKEAIERLMQEAGARGWRITEVKPEKQSLRAVIDPSEPPAQAFKAWLETKLDVLEERGLDRKTVRRMGLEALREAADGEK